MTKFKLKLNQPPADMNTIQFNLIRIANELKNSIDAIFTFDKSAQINETLGNYCAEKDWLV